MTPRFPAALHRARKAKHLSLAALSEVTFVHRTHIHHMEAGRRTPSREFAEAADVALAAGGRLVAAFDHDETERMAQAATRKTMAASLAASRDLVSIAELDLDALHDGVSETAVDYLSTAPGPMLHRAHALRDDVLARLRDHRHGPADRSDLLVAAGRLSGVLAYATLDLGDADMALEHTHAGVRCAQAAGDAELLMWMRGTQSLICRFEGDYGRALQFVDDGLLHTGDVPGTGEARLLSGRAQCLANLGDSREANATLNEAERARAEIRRPDSIAGLFAFSEVKQRYYSGSSLIWLDGGDDARRAEREAMAAIDAWQRMPLEQRSLDDERLSHIYVATARLQLDDVEGAAEIMRPIFDLPAEDLISWIVKRAGRVGSMLSANRYAGSPTAAALREDIAALAG